ncbi:MAG: transposase [Cytophagaceae bacterium]|nr:transposase [Cytophagaceae bacterium]
MANTYKRILLHLVFAVKNREAVLVKSWRPKLFEYIHGIVNQLVFFIIFLERRHLPSTL